MECQNIYGAKFIVLLPTQIMGNRHKMIIFLVDNKRKRDIINRAF
jgi:hypothetical protein